MANQNTGLRPKYVIAMVGALIAYCVGASFGTGQEFMQFYGVHGYYGAIGMFLQNIIMIVFCVIIFLDCRKYHFKSPKDCILLYCGNILGTLVYYYTVIYMYCMLLQLISGAGSVCMEYYQIPYAFGAFLMAGLSIMAVMIGMEKIISIISKIAPLIVILVLVVAVSSLINPTDGIMAGTEIARSADVLRVSDNWIISFILHNSYAVLFFLPFLVNIATDEQASKKEMTMIAIFGQSVIAAVAIVMILAMVANFSVTGNTQAPNLILASRQMPFVAAIFAVILLAAIFTTISPIAIMVANVYAKPGTTRYRLIGSASILIALGISFVGTYSQILNAFASVSGWIGLGVYACMFITKIFRRPDPDQYQAPEPKQEIKGGRFVHN